jgi:chitodextrinase
MLSSEILTASSGTHTLGAVSLVDSNPKSIRVQQPGTTLYWYVEYRIRYGTYDNFTAGSQPTTGVLIRQAPNSTRTQSQLLDANPATTTFNDAAFVPGTTFVDSIHNVSIRVDSVSATSATITVNPTATPDTTPPSTPGNFSATAAGSSTIQLTWTASTDNVGVTGYEIRRDGVLIASPTGTATTFTDTGRTPGVTYGYSIVARDAAGNTSGTATTTGYIEPPPPDTTPPSTPGNFSATAADSSSIQLTWTASIDNVGVTGYEIRRDGVLIATPSGSATSYTDGGRTPGVTYGYSILARDAAGNVSGTATTTGYIDPPPPGDTTPPTAPTNLRVTGTQGANASLACNAASDNDGDDGYRIYING